VARKAGGARAHVHEPEGANGLRLSLERERRKLLDGDGVAGERHGLGADQNLARRGRLLQARGDVDGVPRRERLVRPGDHLARVDAHPQLEAHAVVPLELGAERRDHRGELVRGADGANGVVLVHDRHAEHGHHRVADELLDRAAVALDDAPRLLEVAREDPAEALGVELLAEGRRPGDVGEDDRDGLAMLTRGGLLGERGAAGVAEARPFTVLGAARGAGTHRRSLHQPVRRHNAPMAGEIPVRVLDAGVEMPVLGLGVWQMAEGRETEQAVEWALEAGYRHIDTAQLYRNERSVGAAVARSGLPREQVFVTTKWVPLHHGARHELERSLERLGFAYVDLYLIHWPVPGRSGHGWRELEQLRERGLARAIGVSNYGADRLERVVSRASRPPAVNQVHFSPFHYRRELLERCERLGVVLEAYSPLERGGRDLDHPTVVEVASRLGRTAAQVMLRWAIQRGAVVIPKSIRQERIVANARLFDFALRDEDMRALDALDRTGGTGRAR
jgi:diketogulonate reductase-like aldo/keto reductase